jgi:metal-dependent amidase/aminoacylase/carboxypeptidase family protein
LSDNEPRYEGFDVPFSTASVGQFHGGIADNVVPRDAEFRYEFRDLPTANVRADAGRRWSRYAQALEPAMKKGRARGQVSASRPFARYRVFLGSARTMP